MFDWLGKIMARRWPWVLALWLVGVPLIKWAAPPWEVISQDEDIKAFPPHFDSVVGYGLLRKAFPRDVFNSQVVGVVRRADGPLSEADLRFIDLLASRLNQVGEGGRRTDAQGRLIEDRYALGKFITPTDPIKGKLLRSRDRRAALMIAPCQATYMSVQVIHTIRALRQEIDQMRQRGEIPAGLDIALTGSAGVGADLQMAMDESLDRSFWVTIVLVIVILLLVYRSPIVAMIPIATISVSVVTSMSIMALLTLVPWMHFQVLKITPLFVIVVLYGAGTDYCLFLIGRYREELERGADRCQALRLALRHVGGALAASAATVICGLGMMAFADFGKIRYTGPAVAVSLSVALVGVLTLAPALLRLLGPFVFWPYCSGPQAAGTARLSLQQRLWEGVARRLVRRPAAIWLTSVLVLLPLAVWGAQIVPTYDYLAELHSRRDSKRGAEMIRQHFPPGQLGSLKVLLETAGADLRSSQARDDIAELTRRLYQGGKQPGSYYRPELIAQVRSLTSPLGERPGEKQEPRQKPAPAGSGGGGLLGGLLSRVGLPGGGAQVARQLRTGLATAYYVSSVAGGRVTRLEVVFAIDPFSSQAMSLLHAIGDLVRDFTTEPGRTLSGASVAFAGITSTTNDLRTVTQSDQRRINILVILGVYAVLIAILRRPVISVYLMFTVLLGYFATVGITECFFHSLHLWSHPDVPFLGLDWKVAFFVFIILVAVGQDYNIFLMSRVLEEERRHGPVQGVRVAVARTGGIISSCGCIMAGTFGSMATGTLTAIIQIGFALALGVLLDTFIVRPILVPAFLILIERLRPGRPVAAEAAPTATTHAASPTSP